MSDPKTCSHELLCGSVWSRVKFACGKPAKVERDGKSYCGIHDPERVNAKREKRDAKWKLQAAIRAAGYDVDDAERELVDAVMQPGAHDFPAAERDAVQEARARLQELRQKSAPRDPATVARSSGSGYRF